MKDTTNIVKRDKIMQMSIGKTTASIIELQTLIQEVRFGIYKLELSGNKEDECVRHIEEVANLVSQELTQSILVSMCETDEKKI